LFQTLIEVPKDNYLNLPNNQLIFTSSQKVVNFLKNIKIISINDACRFGIEIKIVSSSSFSSLAAD